MALLSQFLAINLESKASARDEFEQVELVKSIGKIVSTLLLILPPVDDAN